MTTTTSADKWYRKRYRHSMAMNLRLPEELTARLRELSEKTGRSQQDLAREALQEYVRDYPVRDSRCVGGRRCRSSVGRAPGRSRTESLVKVYLDSSELVHRAQAIRVGGVWRPPLEGLDGYALVTSAIARVELNRTLLRSESSDAAQQLTAKALTDVDSLAPSLAILESAAVLPVRFLKSLDAIHIASALLVEAHVVLTRDRQMQRACEELGLAVA